VNVPDPADPKVRDAFISASGSRVTIEAVGSVWVLIRYPNGDELPTKRDHVAEWTPAPPPLITEDVVLFVSPRHIYGQRDGGHEGTIVLHHDGTWTEVAS
jgi:hypothetical protein